MGMFDELRQNIICPYCKKGFRTRIQVKWDEYPKLRILNKGSNINTEDGIYDWATYLKPLSENCPNCKKQINFTVEIKNNKIGKLVIKKRP